MPTATAVAFIVGHFTAYGSDKDLDSEELTNLALSAGLISATAVATLALITPIVSWGLGTFSSVPMTYLTGILGQLTTAMDIFLEAGISLVVGFLAAYVGYGVRMLLNRYDLL